MRRGMTLIELLVVLGIILALTAVAIPVVKMISTADRIRDASDVVTSTIQAARISSVDEGNRRYGVALFRDPNNHRIANKVVVLREQDPYAGDMTGSKCQVQKVSSNPSVFHVRFKPAEWSPKIVCPGDHIRIASGSEKYFIGANSTLDSTKTWVDFDTREVDANGWSTTGYLSVCFDTYNESKPAWPDAPAWSGDQDFLIERQLAPHAMAPTIVSNSACIDLTASGIDRDLGTGASTFWGLFGDTPLPISIIFTREGEIHQIYCGQNWTTHESVFLMVGERDRAPKDDPDAQHPDGLVDADDGVVNWRTPSNSWIVITNQGRVFTADNAVGTTLGAARKFARDGFLK